MHTTDCYFELKYPKESGSMISCPRRILLSPCLLIACPEKAEGHHSDWQYDYFIISRMRGMALSEWRENSGRGQDAVRTFRPDAYAPSIAVACVSRCWHCPYFLLHSPTAGLLRQHLFFAERWICGAWAQSFCPGDSQGTSPWESRQRTRPQPGNKDRVNAQLRQIT